MRPRLFVPMTRHFHERLLELRVQQWRWINWGGFRSGGAPQRAGCLGLFCRWKLGLHAGSGRCVSGGCATRHKCESGPPFITSPDISYQFCFNIKNSIIIGEDGEAPGIANWDDITISWLQNVVTTNMTFEAGANGQFYLPINSSCRDAGTTDIDPVLLAELPTMTTYAPQDGGWPDTNPNPDIGYHYPEHEYYYMENANGFGLVNAGETNWVWPFWSSQPARRSVKEATQPSV